MLNKKRGITLIETVVALAVLTTAVTAIVGTVLYSHSTYVMTSYRLVATGLAREGVEVARNVRDANWLPPNSVSYCGTSGQPGYIGPGQYCYVNWTDGLEGCANGCKANFNPGSDAWSLLNQSANYGLRKFAGTGAYSHIGSSGETIYYRKIRIVEASTSSPYTSDHPELAVISTVAWTGNGCEMNTADDPEDAPERCKIVIEDRLTNWKDY